MVTKGWSEHGSEINRALYPVLLKSARRRSFRSKLSCLGAACALMAAATLQAQRAKPTDYEVKAAYLYNLGKFVTWPAQTKGQSLAVQFNLCIMGKDPFGPGLDAIVADETVDGAKVAVKRTTNVQELTSCKIVFISNSEQDRLKTLLDRLPPSLVLTVSDIPGFTDSGGMIEFVVQDRRVRFIVNLTAAQDAGLTLSSELLKVAANVKRPPTPGGH